MIDSQTSSIGDTVSLSDNEAERLLTLELQKATAALRESEELNTRLIACSRDCIKVLDLEGRLLFMNEGGREALEICDFAAVVNKPWIEFWRGEDRESARAALEGACNGETKRFVGFFATAITRQPRWWDVIVSPILNSRGEPERLLAVSRDITERHVAEEMFRSIVIGTASATGADFFPSLVRHMALALRARYAFVAQCTGEKRAHALAFWKDGELAPNFELQVIGTPCERVMQGETCYFREDIQDAFPADEPLQRMDAESYLGVPMLDSAGRVLGHMVVIDGKPTDYDFRQIDVLKIFAARAAAELKRQRAENELQNALAQVQMLQERLQAENLYLQEEIQTEHNFEEIVGRSPAILDVLRTVETVATTDSTVLILGETGCGKELIARAIHSRSKRKERPLVKLNCGAIPTGLVESELFGHRKGAFTGALENRIGRFELANGGTLFLDEVSELPLDVQVKLLRVLQEREFEPLGTSRTIRVNVRIIAASNRDLDKAVKEGRFRADLYFRLNVLPISLPPLRQRSSDIPLLTTFFVERFSRELGKHFTGMTQETMDLLCRYEWPGNIRELQNVIERAVVLSPGSVLRLNEGFVPVMSNIPPAEDVATDDSEEASLEQIERRHIRAILKKTDWVIEGAHGAAQILGLHPNTLRSRMKKLGIARARD